MTYFLEEHAKKKFSILNHIILEANMNKPNNKTIANTIKLLLFDIFHSPKIKFLVLITLLMHIPMAALNYSLLTLMAFEEGDSHFKENSLLP